VTLKEGATCKMRTSAKAVMSRLPNQMRYRAIVCSHQALRGSYAATVVRVRLAKLGALSYDNHRELGLGAWRWW